MRWMEFQHQKQQYRVAWEALLTEFSGDIRQFLNRSYLVIVYGTQQMPFELSAPHSIAIEYPDFYLADGHSERLLNLGIEYRSIKDQNPDRKKELLEAMQTIKPADLSVVDFTVEIRFPTVEMDFIQQIKSSTHANQALMDMSKVSIRVVLNL